MTLSPRQKRVIDQAVEWVGGRPGHNKVDNECCPDFSCCIPELFETDRVVRTSVLTRLLLRYEKESHQ